MGLVRGFEAVTAFLLLAAELNHERYEKHERIKQYLTKPTANDMKHEKDWVW